MKKILTILVILFVAQISEAQTVRTVDNQVGSNAQFASLQTALDSAQAGDIILVQGSLTSYGSVSITKKVHLIGPGIKPNTPQARTASISSLILYAKTSGQPDVDESIIEGFVISSVYFYNTSGTSIGHFNNIKFRRNFVYSTISFGGSGQAHTMNDIQITENWFASPSSSQASISGGQSYCTNTNIVIERNLFNNYYLSGFAQSTTPVLVKNNTFYYGGSYAQDAFSGCTYFVVENNIFEKCGPGGLDNSTFYNNITFNTYQNTLPYGTNTGIGNISANPQITSPYPSAYGYSPANISSYNYNVSTTSAAKNAGTDGNDMGFSDNDTGYTNRYMPARPFIQSMSIPGTNVPAGGSINVTITGQTNQ